MKTEIVYSYEYKPFGDTLSTTAGETARIGFIGQEQDIEHGYFNMGARYYDPEIGRFLSVDPLFEQFAEQTPYNYCFNSPLINSDASGLSPDKEKKRDQMHATEIDLFAFNQSSVMMNQSRYEDSRNPSYLELMLANLQKKEYLLSILGAVYYNNFFGGGGGSKGGRTGNPENGKNGTSNFIMFNQQSYSNAFDKEKYNRNRLQFISLLKSMGVPVDLLRDMGTNIDDTDGMLMSQVEVSDESTAFLDLFVEANKRAIERMKEYLPDAYTLSVGFTGIAGTGAGTSIDVNYILKGKDASIIPTITITQNIGIGYDVNAYISGNITYYYGEGDFLSGMFETSIKDGFYSFFGSISAENLIGIGYDGQVNVFGTTHTHGINIGIAPPGTSVSVGLSNTYIIWSK
jgi:RHS repeat-associated protein